MSLNGEKIATTRDLERAAAQKPYMWKLMINGAGR